MIDDFPENQISEFLFFKTIDKIVVCFGSGILTYNIQYLVNNIYYLNLHQLVLPAT